MPENAKTTAPAKPKHVMLTGATGFVGRNVLRELLKRDYVAICLVRSKEHLESVSRDLDASRIVAVEGSLFDGSALNDAVAQAQAAIHLVGIILERPSRGQTFDRIHRQGTSNVVHALEQANVRRYVHMSALGTRPTAVSNYHKTKFAAEEHVRGSGLSWTIFRPSLIHGPDGEFMRLMKRFVCGLIPPVIPYFGSGQARLQPVSVKDVAHCFVDALEREETVGQTYEIGGPKAYTWKELYRVCRRLMPRGHRWKPIVSLPVPIANMVARTVMKTPLVPMELKFNVDQVQMSQEDSTCCTRLVEQVFGIELRDFEDELSRYATRIGMV